MNVLTLKLRLSTPAFLRGATSDAAELRAPSIKGLLRWWYRAWNPLAFDPTSPWAEGRIFGGLRATEGQSPFVLRLEPQGEVRTQTWEEVRQSVSRLLRRKAFGLEYLGFSFQPNQKDPRVHAALAQGTTFFARHFFRREPTREQARGLVAAWWLLAHLGGVGARSRRGFGSLLLEDWSWPGQEDLLGELPLPGHALTGQAWANLVREGLQIVQRLAPARWTWEDGQEPPRIAPNLGPGTKVVLRTEEGWRTWAAALDAAGQTLKEGRREQRDPRAPVEPRVTFGLPLNTGRGAREKKWRPGSFLRKRLESNRHTSPLHLSIGAWRDGYGQVWSLLAGPRPGIGEYRVRLVGRDYSIREQARDGVADFITRLSQSGVPWEAGK